MSKQARRTGQLFCFIVINDVLTGLVVDRVVIACSAVASYGLGPVSGLG